MAFRNGNGPGYRSKWGYEGKRERRNPLAFYSDVKDEKQPPQDREGGDCCIS